MNTPSHRLITSFLTVPASAMLWALATRVHRWINPSAESEAGIDVLYIGAGIRMLLLIIGGVWAAIGLAVGNFLLAPAEPSFRHLGELIAFSVLTGFAPWVAMHVSFRLAGAAPHLKNLRPLTLAGLCLAIAAGSSLLHTAYFCALGTVAWSAFFTVAATVALHDYIGCLIVIFAVAGVFRLVRSA